MIHSLSVENFQSFEGMNAVVRSLVRVGIYNHCKVFGIRNSFQGLANGELKVCFSLIFFIKKKKF